MFDFVRDHTRLALGFLLLLIIPSFVFFGVQGYSRFTDGANAAVAKVDGQGISRNEWEEAHKRTLDMVRRQSPNVDIANIDSPAMRRDTLDAMVRERVLLAAANQLHLFPAASRMQRLFDSDPQFAGLRGPDGKLNRELLAMQGMSPELFDQRFRQDLGVRQVLSGITQTVPPPVAAAGAALDAFLQRREVQVQRFDAMAYRDKIVASDADIEAYYKSHESKFKAPEQASIEYVVLDLATLSKGITVSDADLRKAYDERKASFNVLEERRASHILIAADKDRPAAERAAAKARAQALLAEVRKAPATFAEVARKNSQDPGSAAKGGDLDFFAKGAMVKPFEDVAFAMKVGEISDVVESDFGFHVISLVAVRGGEAKPLEAVRGELEAELRKTGAQKLWAASAEQFTNMVYEQSDSLQPVIDKLKLSKLTGTVQRGAPAPGSAGPLTSSKLLDAVFNAETLKAKRNTDAVETGPNQLVSARVLQHQPARLLALAEVKDKVRDSVMAEQSAAQARKEGQARLAALQGGASDALPASLIVSRNNSQGLPPPALDAVLRADTSKLPTAVGVDLPGQGFAVIRISQVLPREPAPGGDEPLRVQYAQAWGMAESDAYVAALKKRYKVEIKPGAEAAMAAGDAASGASR
jgi:peptidyl-prolyl cis-trans isomerase D